ncbi:MAG: hypothetical protein IKQ52_07430 [Bacteroidales bacterium]|nr:hypothetical protein [Bacteroidales bacterium]
MKKVTTLLKGFFLLVCCLAIASLATAQNGQWGQWCYKDYNYTGSAQTFTVPANCTKVTVEAIGGGGAGGYAYKGRYAFPIDYYRLGGGGGGAAYVRTENRTVSSGNQLTINVGQGGRNSGDGNATTVYMGTTKWLEAAGGKHGQWSRSGKEGGNLHAAGGAGGSENDSYYIGTGTKKAGGNGGKAKDFDTGLSANQVGSGSGGGAAGGTGSGSNGADQAGGNDWAISSEGGNGGGGDASGLISGATWLKGGKGANGRYWQNDWGAGFEGNDPGAGGSGGRADENHGPYNGGNGGDGFVRVWFYIESSTPLTLTVGTTSTSCPYTLTANATNELFTKNYKWSTGATNTSIEVSPGADITYTVTVTDVFSGATSACQIQSINSIDVNKCQDCGVTIASATASASEVCVGGPSFLSATLESDDPNASYAWSVNNYNAGTSTSLSNYLVTPTSTTTYAIKVTITKGNCTASDTRNITVTVNEKVDPIFASLFNDGYCASTLPAVDDLPPTSDNNFTGTWAYSTSDSTYTFTPAAGQCANKFTKKVTISDDPTPGEIEPNIVVCDNQTIYTFNNATSAAGGINGSYAWQVSLDQNTWAQIPDATNDSYVPMTDLNAMANLLGVSATGTFYFRRAWTNDCEDVYSNVLSLDNPGTLAPGAITADGNQAGAYCADATVTAILTANPEPTVASPSFTYQWQSSTDGTTWTNISGATASSYNVSLNPVQKISYRYQVKYSSCDWMTSNNKYEITESALPVVNSITAPTDLCPGKTSYELQADITSSAAIDTYTWGENATGSTATGTVTATLPNCGQTYNYSLKVKDVKGCESAVKTGSFTTTTPTMTIGTISSMEAVKSAENCKYYVPSQDDLDAAVNSAITSTCGNTVTLSNINPAAGSLIDATTTVTATATDMCGNTETVSIEVTVPTVTFSIDPTTETFTLPYGAATMDVTLTSTPSFEPSDLPYTYENDLQNPLGVGTHNITWTLKDECGNPITTAVEEVNVVLPECEDAVTLDGYDYPVVRVGYDCWFKENVKATTDIADVVAYKNDPDTYKDKFGMLYTWYAAVAAEPETGSEEGGSGSGPALMMPMPIPPVNPSERTQGICPEGWAIPTVEDFQRLFVAAGSDVAYLKDMDATTWTTGKCGIEPSTGFDARGAGYYLSSIAAFQDLLSNTRFWTDKAGSTANKATCCEFNYYCSEPMFKEISSFDKVSVRCIKINSEELPTPPPAECPSVGTPTIEFLDGNTSGYTYDNYKLRMRVSTPIHDYDAEKVDGAEYIAHYRNPGASYAKDHTIASTGSDNPYYANMWVTEDGVFVADIYYDDDNFMGIWDEIDQIQIYLEANIDCVPDGVDQSESVILKSVTNCPIYHPSSVMDKYLNGSIAATVSIDNFTSGSVDMNSISWTVSANGITKTYTPANNNTQIEVGIEASTSSSNSGDQWIALSWDQLIADFGTPIYKLSFVPSMGTTCDGNPVTVTGFPTTFPIATSPEECPSVVEDPDYIVDDEFFITLYEGSYAAAIPFDFEGIGEVEVEGSYYLEPYSGSIPTKYDLSDAMYTVTFDNYDNHYWIEIYIPVNAQGLPSAGLSADQILHVSVHINHPECSGVLVTGTYQQPAAPAVECPTPENTTFQVQKTNGYYAAIQYEGGSDNETISGYYTTTTNNTQTALQAGETVEIYKTNHTILVGIPFADVTLNPGESITVTLTLSDGDCEPQTMVGTYVAPAAPVVCPSIGEILMNSSGCQNGVPSIISVGFEIDNYDENMVDVDNSGILIKDMNQNTIATLTVGTNNNNSHSIIISGNKLIASFYNHYSSSNNEFGSSFYVVPFLRTNCSDGMIGDTYHNAAGDPVLVTCE